MESIKSISLYEMVGDLSQVMDMELESEEQLEEMIVAIREAMENKSESIIAVIRNYETRINAVKEEEKRLSEYRKSEEKKLERLKEYTIYCMEQLGNKKLDTNLGKISLRKKPASLIITDEDKIPNEYKLIEQIVKIDKARIKKDLKEKVVDGVELVESGNSLSIK